LPAGLVSRLIAVLRGCVLFVENAGAKIINAKHPLPFTWIVDDHDFVDTFKILPVIMELLDMID
jgi:hypothetical protein